MSCTMGWIGTDEGFILFKNRDTVKKYLESNVFKQNDGFARVGYTGDRKGCWIGVNEHGVGFTSAKGPYRETPSEYSSWIKFNEIGESVLRKAKNLSQAKEMFLERYDNQKIGESANIFLCGRDKGCVLEFCLDEVEVKEFPNQVVRTPPFEAMTSFNSELKSLGSSKARLRKMRELLKERNVRSAEDLIPPLTYHSEEEGKSICRHEGKVMTVGSCIFEVKSNEISAFYNINNSPCEGEFGTKVIKI